MRIAPYWKREQREIAGMRMKLRSFSFCSQEEACARLEAKAQLLQEFYSGTRSPREVEQLRRRLRELNEQAEGYSVVVAEARLEELDEHNIITRNRYGVEVLNSADTCFLDVDTFPAGLAERLLSLLGKRFSDEERLLKTARRLCAEHEQLAMRVYRTARGWRIMAEAPGLSPDSPLAQQLMKALHVDALYADLCRKQACWRARLTPKPHRAGMPCAYPHPAEPGELTAEAEEWLAAYRAKCEGMAVCRLVDTFGPAIHSRVVQEHDARTLALKPDLRLV